MATTEENKRGWRYYVGLFLFVLAMMLPLLGLIFVPLLGWVKD